MAERKFPIIAEEQIQQNPVLIVDQQGFVGSALAKEIKKSTAVILVAGKEPNSTENLAFIRYHKSLPQIPDAIYSHIFFTWNGERETYELLPEFLEKAKKDNSKFVFIISYKNFHPEIVRQLINIYSGVTFIVIGDLFGGNVPHEHLSVIDELIYKAKSSQRVSVAGMGLGKLHPVYFSDAINGILHGSLGMHTENVFFIATKHTITQLGLAHLLKKIDPLIRLDFEDENASVDELVDHAQAHGTWILGDGYDVEKRIKEFYESVIVFHKTIEQQPQIKTRRELVAHRKFRLRRIFRFRIVRFGGLFITMLIIIFIFLPMILTPILVYAGSRSLLAAKDELEQGKLSGARAEVAFADLSLNNAERLGKVLSFEAQLVGLNSIIESFLGSITIERQLADDLSGILEVYPKFKAIFEGKSIAPQQDFLSGLNTIQQSLIHLQSAQLTADVPTSYSDKLKKLSLFEELFSNTAAAYPSIVGMDRPKTYLILFQNNMELRPGGGFIGSYGLLKFDKGQIKEFSIHDVYDVDGQLKEHIEPPFAIRRYLPLVHLYLRDSNFDVDFTKDAAITAILLREETKEQVDGVIGADLSFVQSIIQALGSINVLEYNQTVDSNNFFLLTEQHAEKNSFAGSSQKKDFLRSLFVAIQEKFNSNPHISYLSLFENTANAIRQKHLLFAFADPVFQNLFTVNGMSSSLWDGRNAQEDTINDFIGVNDANIGVNKANYFIKRGITKMVNIDDRGIVTGQIRISYTNSSQKDQWPGGDYKNYLRIILPLGTTLDEVDIDGQKQKIVQAITDPKSYEKKGFIPPSGLEVESYDEDKNTVYGFLVIIPAQTQRTISISYTLAKKVQNGNPVLHYSLNVFKQPGTDNDPFGFSLNYPGLWKILNADDATVNGQNISELMNLDTDKVINVDFTKK